MSASLIPRDDLCAPPPAVDGSSATTGRLVAALCHVTDLHVLDAASPARFEWIQTLAHDPRWQPLLHMHRPYELLVPHAVTAQIDTVNRNRGGATGLREIDLVVSTGDNIDNAQRNELDAYLSLMSGGEVSFDPDASVQRADPADPAGNVVGTNEPWPYWTPESTVVDVWKQRGYPSFDDFWTELAKPLFSPGWALPWTALPGNHDLMCQGTAWPTPDLLARAVGPSKAIEVPAGFAPHDAANLFVEYPDAFLGAGHRSVVPNPARRFIDLAEWVAAHNAAGALGWSDDRRDVNTSTADTMVDVGEISVIMLDTNHPAGDYQGSIARAQLDWLDQVLTDADRQQRLVIVASHHGSASLVNTRGDDAERLLGDAIVACLGRHASCVAWLTGHRHINEIRPHHSPSGGFWEITTSSLIDWPVERRLIDVVRHNGGVIEIATRVVAADLPDGSLAALHRSLAERFAGRRATTMSGAAVDRDVRLFVPR